MSTRFIPTPFHPFGRALAWRAAAVAGALLLGGCARGAIGGRVLDVSGSPVPAASIRMANGRATSSGADGTFRLAGLRSGRQQAVNVSAAGFAQTLQLYPVLRGQDTRKDVFLVPQQTTSFTAESGGTIALPEGAAVVIPPNALVKANGEAATGPVTARTAFIDPRNPAQLLASPGELVIGTGGAAQPLVSGGMVKVDLTNAQGERLDLAPGRTAEVRMPAKLVTRNGIPVGGRESRILGDTVPATGLYLFNTETRRWEIVDTLKAVPGSNFLSSQTPSLGPWLNFDKPELRSCMEVRVRTPAGTPRVNTSVIAIGLNYNGFNERFTDALGRAQLMVARNSQVLINSGPATTSPLNTPPTETPCGDAGVITF